jgi:hypothetical protein
LTWSLSGFDERRLVIGNSLPITNPGLSKPLSPYQVPNLEVTALSLTLLEGNLIYLHKILDAAHFLFGEYVSISNVVAYLEKK